MRRVSDYGMYMLFIIIRMCVFIDHVFGAGEAWLLSIKKATARMTALAYLQLSVHVRV